MKLSRYIAAPPATEADLTREWAAIDRRSQPEPHARLRRVAVSMAPLALAAAILVAVLVRRNAKSPLEGAVFGSDTGQAVVELADGSHIEVEPRARLAVVRGEGRAVKLQLQRGSALFEVAHVDGRTFEVQAQSVDVRVLGTRFRIEMSSSERVHIAVERGTVAIARHGSGEVLRTLVAGDESTFEGDGRAVSTATPSGVAAVAPAITALEPPVAVAPFVAPEPKAEPSRGDAHQLFDAATAARRAGKNAVAASLFDALRRRYPADPRAGLSSFELGRLRMDALGDPAGALEALSRAIALSPAGSFREDAQARLVYANDAMHDGPQCKKMRQAYLARYPRGVHAVNVAAKCGD